jgi:sulfide dehydrogenase [flavocytochrome c] flavoprotein chain
MPSFTRRRFTALAGASLAAAPLCAPRALGQAKPKLVVIGGGPGGGTLARYVNKDAAGAIDVTLVEPGKHFTTCFFSNLYVGGFRSFESITHGYDNVARAGVRVVHEWASAIDRERKAVRLASGLRLPYDRLAVAPASISNGIPFPDTRRPPPKPCRTPGRRAARRECCRNGSMH